MSLLVWLPLVNGIENQGLADIKMINHNATANSSGKIGGCYQFNGSSAYINETTYDWTTFNKTSFTLCCWYKQPSPVASGNSQIIHIGTSSGWNNIRIGLLRRTSSGYPLFSVSDGTNSINYNFTATSFSLDTWHHIAVTYDNGKLTMYLDGQVDKTMTTTIVPVITSSHHLGIGGAADGAEKLTGFLNDVRIYDHALSPREIADIAKGLVVHYPLSGISNPNLVPHISLKTSYIVANNDGITFSSVSPSSDSRAWGLSNAQHKINLDPGTYTCTIWIDEPTNNANRAAHLYKTSGLIKNGFATLSERGSYSYTFTLTEQDDVGVEIKIYDGKYHLKIEKGDKATPWIPNLSDPEYTSLGLNDGIEYDVSGYKNHGTKTGTFSISSDTARYASSTVFDGNTYINTTNPLPNPCSQFTVSAWVNLIEGYTANYGYHIIAYSAATYCRICVSKDNAALRVLLRNDSTNYSGSSTMTASSLTANKWNHYAVTFDNGTIKIYINGELDNTLTASMTNVVFPSDTLTIGKHNSELPKAKVSDTRIYATALTASQIIELYQIPISLSRDGTLFATEFVEG